MRGKSVEEIRSAMNSSFCGIFSSEQLPGQQRMKMRRRMVFNIMAMLSFIGFLVKPMSALGNQSKTTFQLKLSETSTKSDDEKTKDKR